LQDLAEWRSEVTHAPCAAAAYEALRDEQIDIVFLDYRLGTDNGLDILTTMRESGDVRPVIVITAGTDDITATSLAKAGADDYILKENLDSDSLRRAISHALGKYQQRLVDQELRQNAAATTRANEKLASSHATLECWAAELEIANARLLEVDHLKTKFLSEVSHEIRTPLAAIVSAAKIITKHHNSRPEVVERFGHTILSEGERLTRMINEFLDLTKIEADCVDWHDTELDTSALVADAISSTASLAMEKSIALSADVPGETPPCHADHDRLIQVLTNLITNAIKHTPEGGHITVSVVDDGDATRFAVHDTGTGIPNEELSKVFERFHQVIGPDGRASRRGSGLGLCICREIVEHYSGRIWAESILGQGSSFQFTIPSSVTHLDGARNRRPTDRSLSGHAVRVLTMLGREDLDSRVLALPKDSHIECRSCTSPDQAMELLSSWKADVAVISEDLSEHLGKEFLNRIQGVGVAHILLYSPQIGLADASVIQSSDTVARSLASLASPGDSVLVCDDNDEYRALLEFQLGEAGYRVTAVDNGHAALKHLSHTPVDAILLDLIMPGMDGLTVLDHLRVRGDKTPVAVLTAMDDPSVAIAARELGAVGVFRKDSTDDAPYRAVLARVQRVLGEILPYDDTEAAATG